VHNHFVVHEETLLFGGKNVEPDLDAVAQIEFFRELTGTLPRHMDGHQHCHVDPALVGMISATLAEFGINVARIPQERRSASLTDSSSDESPFCPRCAEVQSDAVCARRIYSAAGITCPDGFVGCSLCGLEGGYDAPALLRSLDKQIALLRAAQHVARPIVLEVMVHPGYPSSKLTCCDEFDASEDRKRELDALCDDALKAGLLERGFRLCSFNESALCTLGASRESVDSALTH
jgi:predicted glycoside hydrolase/deacetylase ChbG (UPF0249 family)